MNNSLKHLLIGLSRGIALFFIITSYECIGQPACPSPAPPHPTEPGLNPCAIQYAITTEIVPPPSNGCPAGQRRFNIRVCWTKDVPPTKAIFLSYWINLTHPSQTPQGGGAPNASQCLNAESGKGDGSTLFTVCSTSDIYFRVFEKSGASVCNESSNNCRTNQPIILSQHLLSLTGQKVGDIAKLTWTIHNPSLIEHLSLEHSDNDSSYRPIFTVQSPSNNLFTFDHPQASIGKNYYRISFKGNNQVALVSNPIIVEKLPRSFEIKKIQFREDNGNIELGVNSDSPQPINIQVFDINGVRVYSSILQLQAGYQSAILHTKLVSRGVFIVSFSTQSGQVITKRFIRS